MSGNAHIPTKALQTRIEDLAIAGIPKRLIAAIINLDEETLNKYYSRQLDLAEPEAVERVAKTIVMQAINGDSKAQNLYMKTKGAKYGWVEKQVIETVSSEDTQALNAKIKELESSHDKDH